MLQFRAIMIGVLSAGLALPAYGDDLSFAGAYVGLNAGAVWGRDRHATAVDCLSAVFGVFCDAASGSLANGTAVSQAGTGNLSGAGFTGGVQGGYNWKFDNVVLGAEGDFGAFDLGNSSARSGTFPVTFLGNAFTLQQSMSTNWLATLRGRAGITVAPDVMLYGTAGVAFSDLKFSSSYSDNAIDALFPGGTGSASKSSVVTGWTIGGGGEWMLGQGWSLKAEYLYIDFGTKTLSVYASNTPTYTQTITVDADLSAQVARIGFNFRP